jgi:hypothetical protein
MNKVLSKILISNANPSDELLERRHLFSLAQRNWMVNSGNKFDDELADITISLNSWNG